MPDERAGNGRLLALRRYLTQRPAWVAALCLFAVAEACAQTGSWLLVRVAINNGIVAHNERTLDLTLAAFVLVSAAGWLLSAVVTKGMARLGQDLFYPPNVGGWPGGRSWLSSRSLIGRTNFASGLVEGLPVGLRAPIDAGALARQQGKPCDCAGVSRAATMLLFGSEPEPAWLLQMVRTCEADREHDGLRRAVAVVLASPEAQLA